MVRGRRTERKISGAFDKKKKFDGWQKSVLTACLYQASSGISVRVISSSIIGPHFIGITFTQTGTARNNTRSRRHRWLYYKQGIPLVLTDGQPLILFAHHASSDSLFVSPAQEEKGPSVFRHKQQPHSRRWRWQIVACVSSGLLPLGC